MSLRALVWTHAPVSLLKMAAKLSGGFRAREKLGLAPPPWYAYGLLSAADHARKVGVSEIWALEFGVAAGRGLKSLIWLADEISKVTGVSIRIAGFDTGAGMPPSSDFRDHPEKYRQGDYPMVDPDELRRSLGGKAELIIGNINDTVDDFRRKITAQSPIGFVAVDVDTYSSTVSALRVFDGEVQQYLPMTFTYFDDCSNRSHFTKFAGELLAIDEYNQKHDLRKLDIDRGIWNSHRRLGPQLWHDQLYILHVLDHPWRTAAVDREAKILRG